MKHLIEIYKKQRKYSQLSRRYSHQYAFIGIGNHSLNNLYPVLEYMGVPVKYVITASNKTAEVLNQASKKYTAVNDPEHALNDHEIQGVFISASPDSHYNLCSKALKKHKSVFVEKPPCRNLNELEKLISLEKETKQNVVVGMQKRYAPACSVLKKKLKCPEHYTLRYCTGAYPEGEDILTELFIHPVDLITFLFGKAKLVSLIQTNKTLLIQVVHENGIIGALELSTAYAWQMAHEQLTVVEEKGIYELNNLSELLYKKKPLLLGNIPFDKIVKFNPVTEILFNQNTFQPVMQHNNIYVNGFYSELETFISICEHPESAKNYSGLISLKPTYELLDEIRNSININRK